MQSDAIAHTRSDPLVSVVLPVRNGLPYLSAAVDSILNQSYRNFELIVVDDGSIDDGRNWLAVRAVQDDRLRLIVNPGRGLVEALNYGIDQACGTYIARMDADDIALPERFTLQVSFLEAHPEIAVLGTQATHIPIVAPPTIGGLADLVRPDTAWCVDAPDDPESYIAALEACLKDNPTGRCENALAIVRERHSWHSFRDTVYLTLDEVGVKLGEPPTSSPSASAT